MWKALCAVLLSAVWGVEFPAAEGKAEIPRQLVVTSTGGNLFPPALYNGSREVAIYAQNRKQKFSVLCLFTETIFQNLPSCASLPLAVPSRYGYAGH